MNSLWNSSISKFSGQETSFKFKCIIVYYVFPVSTSRCVNHPLETLTSISSHARYKMSLELLTVNRKKAWSIQMIYQNKYINASAGKPDPSYCYNQTFLLHPPFPIWVHTCGCMSLHSISWDASSNRMQMQAAINTIHIFISVCRHTLLKICYSGQNKAKNHLLPRFDPKIYSS